MRWLAFRGTPLTYGSQLSRPWPGESRYEPQTKVDIYKVYVEARHQAQDLALLRIPQNLLLNSC